MLAGAPTRVELELIDDSGLQTVGIRFRIVIVPPGAMIVNAYVQFQVDETRRRRDQPGWPTVGVALDPQRTTDIKNVIHEIVNRPLWSSGNAVVIIITGTTGKRVAESYDGSSTGAPLLHIEYTP